MSKTSLLQEGHLYNCPPIQPYHQRPEFLKYMNMNRAQAYKKKKLKSSSLKGNNTNEADVAIAAEMEVDGKNFIDVSRVRMKYTLGFQVGFVSYSC